MADYVTQIEQNLADTLLMISGVVTQPNGYTYYNDVNTVNIEDDALSIDNDDFNSYPNCLIYIDPSEDVIELNQNAIGNKIHFIIEGRVANEAGVDNPKFAINAKMNELLSDIKYILNDQMYLSNKVEYTHIQSSKRKYNINGDIIHTGTIMIKVEVYYIQSRSNPSKRACY